MLKLISKFLKLLFLILYKNKDFFFVLSVFSYGLYRMCIYFLLENAWNF